MARRAKRQSGKKLRQATKPPPLDPQAEYETREVLAVAYTPKDLNEGRFLAHTVRITGPVEGEHEALCRRVKSENIADGGSNPLGKDKPPTCPTCLRRDPRFSAKS